LGTFFQGDSFFEKMLFMEMENQQTFADPFICWWLHITR